MCDITQIVAWPKLIVTSRSVTFYIIHKNEAWKASFAVVWQRELGVLKFFFEKSLL